MSLPTIIVSAISTGCRPCHSSKSLLPPAPPANRDTDTARTHLYVIGDSFSEEQRLSQDDFRVSQYRRAKWDTPPLRVQLDPAKRNVLLIESIERHFRGHFARPVREIIVERDTLRNPTPAPTAWERIKEDIHWSDVEEAAGVGLVQSEMGILVQRNQG